LIVVLKIPIASTLPVAPPASTKSPTLKGLKKRITTPAPTLH